jgi:hypothetical protein
MHQKMSAERSEEVPRIIPGLCCLGAVVACLAYARYRAGMPDWWRGSGGGIPYVAFWAALGYSFFPRRRWLLAICTWAVVGTCGLEFLQLWKPEWLTQFRATRFGAALLGSGFTWSDMPPYFIGGLIAYFVLAVTSRFSNTKRQL